MQPTGNISATACKNTHNRSGKVQILDVPTSEKKQTKIIIQMKATANNKKESCNLMNVHSLSVAVSTYESSQINCKKHTTHIKDMTT